MKKKIIVAVYNAIDNDGRVKRSCETLSKHYDVILFCLPGSGLYSSDKFEIIRCRFVNPNHSAAVKLFIFWFQFIRLVIRHAPKFIYTHDFFMALPGAYAAKLIGAFSIYDSHELIIPEPSLRMSTKKKFFYLSERISILKHDVVIAANEQRAKMMKTHYRLNRMPFVVRNISQPSVAVVSAEKILNRYPMLKNNDEIYVVYMGDMNLNRGLYDILNAIALLPSYFKLVLVGGGPHLQQIAQSASESNAARILVLGAVDHSEVQSVIGTCDIAIITYSMVGMNNYYCAPNKIFEYAQAGLPMVTSCQPSLIEMIEGYEIGHVVGCIRSANIAAEYAAAIMKISKSIETYKSNISKFLDDHQMAPEQNKILEALNSIKNVNKAVMGRI